MTDVRRLVNRANRECASRRGKTRSRSRLVDAILTAGDIDGFAAVVRAEATPELVDHICAEALDRLCGADPRQRSPTLSDFCLGYGLLPSDDARRVVFLHATGRSEQARALDPDGGLLAAGYAGAGEDVRRRVRDAVVTGSDPVPVRALVTTSGRAHVGELGYHDVQELATKLWRAEAWERLWELVRDAAVVHIGHARSIPASWQPADAADRALLAKVRATRLWGSLTLRGRGAAEVAVPSSIRETKPLRGTPLAAAFSPDGASLAVAIRTSPDMAEGLIVHRRFLGDDRYDAWRFDGWTASVVHLGQALIAADASGIVRHGDARASSTRLYERPVRQESLSRFLGGYAVAAGGGGLVLGSLEGRVRQVSVTELGFDGPVWDVVTDGDGLRLAVSSATGLVVLDNDANVLARYAGPACQPVAFDGADHLITRSDNEIRRWRIDEQVLVRAAATDAPSVARIKGRPILLPVHRRLMAIRTRETTPAYYDADTLEETSGPVTLGGLREPVGLAASSRGRFVAVVRDDLGFVDLDVELYDTAQEAVVDLLNTPMCAMRPPDAERAAFYARLEPAGNVAEYLDLLQAFLTRRFRGEIALGRRPTSGDRTDILVSDEEG